MRVKLTCLLMYLLTAVLGDDNIDCIEGETWFQPCQHCRCLKNGEYTCKKNSTSCKLTKCIKDIVIFQKNLRCHCARNNSTVCVPLLYQAELNGKTCSEDYYYYDSCTLCRCNHQINTLQCTSINNCDLSSGGVCNDGEEIFEDNCYKCNCTFTKFKKCVMSEDCRFSKEKPGNCYTIQNYYSRAIQYLCLSVIKQECHNDYNCPGQKKCCHVADCYMRCVDPYLN